MFQPDGTVGRSGQVLISKISDPEAGMIRPTECRIKSYTVGFLLSESFIVRIDFRLVLPENDKHTFFVDTRSGKFTVRSLVEYTPSMELSLVGVE